MRKFGNVKSVRISAATMLLVLIVTGCATTEQAPAPGDAQLAQLQSKGPNGLAATLSPVKSAEEAVALGDQALARGDREEAILHFVRAAEIQPKDPGTLYKIGLSHSELGNVSLAALGFRMALEVDSDYVLAHEALGLLLMRARNLEDARKHLGGAVALDPKRWRSHNGLGILADLRGDFGNAVGHYASAIDLQPQSAMLMSNLGYSYYLQGEFNEAQSRFERAIALEPRYYIARRNLAIIHIKFRQFDKALRLLAVNGNQAAAYNDLGYLSTLAGEYAVARKSLNRAIELSPAYYARAQENLAHLERRASRRAQVPDPQHGSAIFNGIRRPEHTTISAAAISTAPALPLTPVPTTSGQAGETVPLGDSKRDSPIDEHSVLVERLRATDAWLRAHGDDDYTIQLMYLAGSARAELEEFLAQQKRRGLLKNTFVYEFFVDSAKRYYVLYSKFSSHALAAKAVAELPVPLQLHKPYVRNISNFRS